MTCAVTHMHYWSMPNPLMIIKPHTIHSVMPCDFLDRLRICARQHMRQVGHLISSPLARSLCTTADVMWHGVRPRHRDDKLQENGTDNVEFMHINP